jgi:branched-chain amino acid transport system permease protein
VLRIGSVSIGYENIAIIAATVLLCVLLFAFFRLTRIGVAMQAASQNQLAAYYCGVPVKHIYSLVWAMSSAIAATAGVLVAPITLVDPIMGFVAIKAFAAAIVGGFGSLQGAMVGGLLIGVVEQFAGLYLPTGFADTTAYLILLLMLLVRPEGIFATIQRKKV